MAILEILKFPDERLRLVADPVIEVNDEIRKIVADMLETMYADNGIGLAAIQVNIKKQIIVMDLSGNDPQVFINPEILEHEGTRMCEEGCLSVPGIWAKVERYDRVKFKALDKNGKEMMINAEGLLSQCIQHEMDHLRGKLYVDYLSPLKRERIRKKLVKAQKLQM